MKWQYCLLVIASIWAIIGLHEYRVSYKQELIETQEEYIQTLEKYAATSDQALVLKREEIHRLKDQIIGLEKTQTTRVINATITSYSPRKGETDSDPYVTASMEPVREGSVAVSRDLFYRGWVFGRKIYIKGEGVFTITDLMHARKTNQIDIFRFNTKAALEFGKQQRKVVLLGQD